PQGGLCFSSTANAPALAPANRHPRGFQQTHVWSSGDPEPAARRALLFKHSQRDNDGASGSSSPRRRGSSDLIPEHPPRDGFSFGSSPNRGDRRLIPGFRKTTPATRNTGHQRRVVKGPSPRAQRGIRFRAPDRSLAALGMTIGEALCNLLRVSALDSRVPSVGRRTFLLPAPSPGPCGSGFSRELLIFGLVVPVEARG